MTGDLADALHREWCAAFWDGEYDWHFANESNFLLVADRLEAEAAKLDDPINAEEMRRCAERMREFERFRAEEGGELSRIFGLSRRQIRRVRLGVSWRHVTQHSGE